MCWTNWNNDFNMPNKNRYVGQFEMQFDQSLRNDTSDRTNWSIATQWQFCWCRCSMITILAVRQQHWECVQEVPALLLRFSGKQFFRMVFVLPLLFGDDDAVEVALVVVTVMDDCWWWDSPRISWPRAADSTVPVGPRSTASKQMMLSRHVAIISACNMRLEIVRECG